MASEAGGAGAGASISRSERGAILLGVAGGLAAGAALGVTLYEAWRSAQGRAHAHQGINRSDSGPRFEATLPCGNFPIQLYSLGTPNGQKVTILLEELGLPYDAHFINIGRGDQFSSGFVAVNPNSKIPAMVDREGPDGNTVNLFESGSMLLYLAEKTGKFIPTDPVQRVECINWLMWQMGSAPYLGQFGHFYKYYAPKRKLSYPIERYTMEAKRIVDVLDKQLAKKQFVCGDQYTIADMAIYPWIRCLDSGYNAAALLDLASFHNVQAWKARIEARPAVQTGLKINGFASEERFKNYSTPGKQ
eukprot:CAMPEP_0202090344 /NCGR_PEP_ID=MMETSP0964-20121228/43342_1 /ASSEMBLY_ACC=CAM_ASM_000500 /TAXON_ID=4773 /ORGANISM="Schizochytrium aggregatum, Strain ATCC28209" /LENGTH=303 /DNA_ID=CAMNT_0048658493 /DNA_START=20 /DNA_END=931 /DNA_ORIENTATION=+